MKVLIKILESLPNTPENITYRYQLERAIANY